MKRFLGKIFFLSLFWGLVTTNPLFAANNTSLYGEAELYSSCGGFIEAPTFAPDGTLWLLDIPADRILKVDNNGKCLEQGNSGGTPNGLQFHPDGRLFVAASNGILIFDQDQSTVTVFTDNYQSKPFIGANDLDFDSEGGLYFTASNGSDLFNKVGQVFYLAPDSTTAVLLNGQLSFPNGIAVSNDGSMVLVAEFAAKRIVSLPAANQEGGFASSMLHTYTEGGVGPDGMTLDDEGRLFVANLGSGKVQVFDAGGALLGSISLPAEAGMFTSNTVVHEGYLYITESAKGEVWRVRLD